MNGTVDESFAVDRRPIITCAGELDVFSAIEDSLSQTLPQDSCEWRRSLGRPVRSVHIGANFAPFSVAALPKGSQWDLIRQPLFHIYWTECSDVDIYKNSVREDIENWTKELTSRDIPDWLIVVVENYDGKRANKLLPRTTVLDKIRADFAPKQGDRCISVISSGKVEAKSADSWKCLVGRIRHLLLVAYSRAVARLEDHVRQQREKRNELGWNFMQYFKLQEELAQVLEMLGLNDEALVQYDELDALFSQFVANGITSECVSWLNNFQKSLEKWQGLKLGPSVLSKNPSLLELRAYLFAKQAHMLLLTNKVWEMASRCLPFLHTCTRELSILELSAPPGAISCWLFLASMEVLQTCDKFNHADEIKEYSLHTASLWEYASQKLRDLGELCGLMPGGAPTSEQLHIVVGLSAGMGDNPGPPNNPSPTDILKLALCHQDVFNKRYLELAELAMGTYKHIGRLRSARLVGRDVASFYMLLGETQKSAAFLGDLVRTLEQDGWHELAAQTQIELAECHKRANNTRKLVRSCASVSAALEIDTLIRWTYFDDMCRSMEQLDKPLVVPFDNIIKLVSVSLKNDSVIVQDSNINVELAIESNFPKEILCSNFVVSLELEVEKPIKDVKNCKDPLLQRTKMLRNLEYKQDKQLAMARIVSKATELRRKDSSQAPAQSEFTQCLEVNKLPLNLTPGLNVIRLSKLANKVGKYHLGQVAIHIGQLQLISSQLARHLIVEVKEEQPSLQLNKITPTLVSGIEQVMNLILTVGSRIIEPKSKIKLTASRGLTFRLKSETNLTESIEFEVGDQVPLTSTRMHLIVFANIQTKEDSQKDQVTITLPWREKPIVVSLNFTPPIITTWRLFTVKNRKFVQVNAVGQCDRLIVENPGLYITGECKTEVQNIESSQVLTNGSNIAYMWEILITAHQDSPTIKAEFTLDYKLDENYESRIYKYFFDINNYQTLYTLDANVEPAKGVEFCRVGSVCHLHLSIKHASQILPSSRGGASSLMYEVLTEQSVWAVCGRTAGVVTFDNDMDPQMVVLDFMPLTSGHLPLPLFRISKYIPAEAGGDKKGETHPRLEPFSPGQVYNSSKGKQVHVITAVSEGHPT